MMMTSEMRHQELLDAADQALARADMDGLRAAGIWREPTDYAFVFAYPTKGMIKGRALSPEALDEVPDSKFGDSAVYLHIPFCNEICNFCPYTRGLNREGERMRYVKALCEEIRIFTRRADVGKVRAVYMGGGTPSVLSAEELGVISATLQECFDLADDLEFTMEFHPLDVQNEELLAAIDRGGRCMPNRISLGIQTFHDETLKSMGRPSGSVWARDAVTRLNELGRTLNIDIISGYPGIGGFDNLTRLRGDIDAIEELAEQQGKFVPSVTMYYLWTRGETALVHQLARNKFSLPSERDGLLSRLYAIARLHDIGYSNDASAWYVRERGHSFKLSDSRWHGSSYLGFGLGAYSYVPGLSYYNATDYPTYYARINAGELPVQTGVRLSQAEMVRRKLSLGVKTRRGIPYPQEWHADAELTQELSDRVEQMRKLGLLMDAEEGIQLTDLGRCYDDEVAEQFFAAEVLESFGKTPVAVPSAA
jgi:oxygen-independent coproporphyrinogen III oxidase